MEYAAMTFWLLVIVFAAHGVHRLWSGLIQPRVVNSLLLPGTLVAQLGHVVGMLITGGTVNNTTLIKDDDSGEPQTARDAKPRIPVVGPVVIAMLPLLACGSAIYALSQYLGQDILARMAAQTVPRRLPLDMAGIWSMLRDAVTLVERLVEAVQAGDTADPWTWVFIYLAICLTVRMAPLPGTLRGAIGAILILGVGLALIGLLSSAGGGPSRLMERTWQLISFSVAWLLLLLLASLTARALVGLIRILFGHETAD